MSKVFFSAKNLGFYPEQLIADFEAAGTLPDDVVELSEAEAASFWKVSPPKGKQMASSGGRPEWVDIAPPSRENVVAMRKSAYAVESDHLKIEAEYDALLTESEPDYSVWLSKVAEIKERYPLPA